MKILFFVLVAMAGHKEVGQFNTYEECVAAEEVVEDYIYARCIPVMEGTYAKD